MQGGECARFQFIRTFVERAATITVRHRPQTDSLPRCDYLCQTPPRSVECLPWNIPNACCRVSSIIDRSISNSHFGRDAFFKRVPPLRFPAHGGQDASAVLGRSGGRLDHLCCFLSVHALDGLRLRASAVPDQRHKKADARAPVCTITPFGVSAHSVRHGFDPVAVASSLCTVAADVDDVDGRSVFCYLVDSTACSELVFPKQARSFTRSLLPILGRQCRQFARAGRVSVHHRTPHWCGRSNTAMGSGISHTVHAARPHCSGALSAPAGGHRPPLQWDCTANGCQNTPLLGRRGIRSICADAGRDQSYCGQCGIYTLSLDSSTGVVSPHLHPRLCAADSRDIGANIAFVTPHPACRVPACCCSRCRSARSELDRNRSSPFPSLLWRSALSYPAGGDQT